VDKSAQNQKCKYKRGDLLAIVSFQQISAHNRLDFITKFRAAFFHSTKECKWRSEAKVGVEHSNQSRRKKRSQ